MARTGLQMQAHHDDTGRGMAVLAKFEE